MNFSAAARIQAVGRIGACAPRLARLGLVAVVVLATPDRAAFAQPPPTAQTVAAATAVPEVLKEANELYKAANYADAIKALELVIARLDTSAAQDAEARATLIKALMLRIRARVGDRQEQAAVNDDFRAILVRDPRHAWPPGTAPLIIRTFEEYRKQSIGEVLITVTPADAVVELDGQPFSVVPGQPVALIAETHKLTATRLGYAPGSQTFQIVAAAPGQAVALALQRDSATLAIVTSPAGVEVILDGQSKGTTPAGPAPAEYAEALAKQSMTQDGSSGRLVVGGIPPGVLNLEFRMNCYTTETVKVEARKPADLVWMQKMSPSVATVTVASVPPGIPVYVDGEAKGVTNITLDRVCEGQRTVEARTTWGRFVRRRDFHAGEKINMKATVRPAFAVLSVTGLPEGVRGGRDWRLDLESMTSDAGSIMFYAPPADRVQDALTRQQLSPGWLSRDRDLRPLDEAAAKIEHDARVGLSAELSKQLGVQGVATLARVPDRESGRFYVNMLAADSGKLDQLEINIDNPASVREALDKLDTVPQLFQISVGMSTIDVLDRDGPIVVRVAPGGSAATAGIAVGDMIVSVDGTPVKSASAFVALVSAKQAGETAKVTFKTQTATRMVDLAVSAVPRVISMTDRTLLMNKLLLDYRAWLARPLSQIEQSVAHLNAAVALGALENWEKCQRELDFVKLPPGRGVSAGTVLYLQALCQEKLRNLTEAERLYKEAAASVDSLLTEDGPSIKVAAERRLSQLRPAIRR